ncbi:MAG: hypothetical protein HY698_03000 [Deltaproteobacteria bacterium]|nr:hypothetical protein [Deltaproteobacteria bacterium]
MFLRQCADYLHSSQGGDRELACLEGSTHQALELCAEVLSARGVQVVRGYKDACDKLVAQGVVSASLAERLKRVFDVADRARLAWSTLKQGDLDRARHEGAEALRELADIFERLQGEATDAKPHP